MMREWFARPDIPIRPRNQQFIGILRGLNNIQTNARPEVAAAIKRLFAAQSTATAKNAASTRYCRFAGQAIA